MIHRSRETSRDVDFDQARAAGAAYDESMKRRKAHKRRRTENTPAEPANDLNVASRAQLGPDEEKRPYRPLADDSSIEDPLQDWPEDER